MGAATFSASRLAYGGLPWGGSHAAAHAEVEHRPPGAAVAVRYNPRSPGRAVVETPFPAGALACLALGALLRSAGAGWWP